METCSKVKFQELDEVREFVFAAEKCDFEINIFYNKYVVNAKSILGVMSMDLSRTLSVKCYGESSEFNRTLRKFAIA